MPSQVTSTSTGPAPGSSRWSWLLPALTFLAGCVLGAVVMGVGDVGGDDEPSTSAAATAGREGSGETDDDTGDASADDATTDDGEAEGGRTVRVPESCLQAADDATALIAQVDRVAAAVADLDPERLRQTVDDVQQVRDEVQDAATQCRDAAGGLEDAPDADAEDAAPATPAS